MFSKGFFGSALLLIASANAQLSSTFSAASSSSAAPSSPSAVSIQRSTATVSSTPRSLIATTSIATVPSVLSTVIASFSTVVRSTGVGSSIIPAPSGVTGPTILAPTTGEVVFVDSLFNIRFAGINSTTVSIGLYAVTVGATARAKRAIQGSYTFIGVIAQDIQNTGFYPWEVPSDLPEGNNYAVAIFYNVLGGPNDNSGRVVSDPFGIAANPNNGGNDSGNGTSIVNVNSVSIVSIVSSIDITQISIVANIFPDYHCDACACKTCPPEIPPTNLPHAPSCPPVTVTPTPCDVCGTATTKPYVTVTSTTKPCDVCDVTTYVTVLPTGKASSTPANTVTTYTAPVAPSASSSVTQYNPSSSASMVSFSGLALVATSLFAVFLF